MRLAAALAIQPDALEAQFACRGDIMKFTASHVDPVCKLHARGLRKKSEVAQARFVIPHPLRGDNQIEWLFEVALRLPEQVIVAIGQHAQFVAR